jgi:hypothetical protein
MQLVVSVLDCPVLIVSVLMPVERPVVSLDVVDGPAVGEEVPDEREDVSAEVVPLFVDPDEYPAA